MAFASELSAAVLSFGERQDEKNDQIALRRIAAGREILRNDERNSNSPEIRQNIFLRVRPSFGATFSEGFPL
jgi:hypothetical protein